MAYEGFGRAPVRTSIVIPSSAVVGVGATPTVIADHAVEVDPGQFLYAVEQLPAKFASVAIKTIGQVDFDRNDVPRLVRYRIICCAADAIRVSVRLDGTPGFKKGTWVSVTGQWDGTKDDPGLHIAAVEKIDQPANPYLSL